MEPTIVNSPNKSWIPITIAAVAIVAIIVAVLVIKKPAQAPAVTPDTNTAGEQTGTSVPHETTNPNPPVTNPPSPTPTVTSYTAAKIALHNSASSCWTIVNGTVYDVTTWISRHPGGQSAILSMCGRDASSQFNNQHGGQSRPESELASFKIGVLAK